MHFSLLIGGARVEANSDWNLHCFPLRMPTPCPPMPTPSQLYCPCCLSLGLEGSELLSPSPKGVMGRWPGQHASSPPWAVRMAGEVQDKSGLTGALGQLAGGGGPSGRLKYPFL